MLISKFFPLSIMHQCLVLLPAEIGNAVVVYGTVGNVHAPLLAPIEADAVSVTVFLKCLCRSAASNWDMVYANNWKLPPKIRIWCSRSI
jgi:hypothetical protein